MSEVKFCVLCLVIGLVLLIQTASAQTTAFNYQGSLNTSGNPANGNHDFEFRLYDALSGGNQIGNTLPRQNITVANGVFAVSLDFGGQFPGANRFLEIRVGPAGGNIFILSPRQPVNSTPYAVKSITADNATNATNATQLGGQTASFYQDATNLNAGTLNAFRLPNPLTLSGLVNNNPIISGTNSSTANASIGLRGNSTATSGATYGVWGQSNSNNGNGVFGWATAASGNTYGVRGQSDSTDGSGVWGYASAASGFTHGGRFQSESTTGLGVYGLASAATGFNSGVYGQSDSTGGSGVFGFANAVTGTTVGVRGDSSSTNGRGVWGFATAITGFTHGVDGQSASTDGRGVYGRATAVTGFTHGVYGVSNSTAGIGVYGQATAGSGTTYGLYGVSNSPTGYGGYFVGRGYFSDNVGLGVLAPAFRLDVASRIRLRQNTGDTGGSNTAGIWLYQNTPNADRAFVGMETDNGVGFFGVNGGGWGLVMNTQTGITRVGALGAAGATTLCRNSSNEISTCSSSLRYKTNINSFGLGLNLIRQLKPITFDWKDGGMHDLGLGAEDVAAIEPLLATYNAKGEIEGVKYDRIGIVLINAVKEQQVQIDEQKAINQKLQAQFEALKQIVCQSNPTAGVCKEEK